MPGELGEWNPESCMAVSEYVGWKWRAGQVGYGAAGYEAAKVNGKLE
jgi:hypothetical protein